MLYLLPLLWQAHYIKVKQFKVTAKTTPLMPQDISRNCYSLLFALPFQDTTELIKTKAWY